MIQIGHFHPLLVHLPIGILILAFIIELYVRRKPSETGEDIVKLTLAAGAISALLSVGTGWLLGEDGGFDETLLFRHRWMAVAFTICSILLYFLKRTKHAIGSRLYLPWFILVILLLGITGHLGGNMTHGEDFLFGKEETAEPVIENVAEAAVFNDIVKPILDKKCVSCHNRNKTKGGLLMTTKEQLLAGGDYGSILDSISGETPQLLNRLHLPMADEEHMPPKGKLQPTQEEIALLGWWMENGHCFDCVAGDLKRSKKIEKMLLALETDTSPRAILAKSTESAPPEWLAELRRKNIAAHRLAEDNPLLIVNLEGRQDLSADDMALLCERAENIVELNLGNSNFDDSLSEYLSELENLTKLQLQNTAVTDKVLAAIENLEYLGSLNLYGTQVTDALFLRLRSLPNLTSLYVWQTGVSEEASKDYRSDHPAVAVQGKIGDEIFEASTLEAPTILSETAFFTDSLKVRLEGIFKDAAVFYTLDGSRPDSTSLRYTVPIVLTNSVKLTAVTQKEGWQPSDIVEADFKKIDVEYASVSLGVPPDGKYKGQFGKTLIDRKRGSTNFVDGQWLGFEGKNAKLTMKLKDASEISSVSVGTLSAPVSWIFFPTGITVWTSSDGTSFKKAGSVDYAPQEPSADVEIKFLDVAIAPAEVKFVRIEVDSPLKNPDWHAEPGGESWIFLDEVLLN